MNLQLYSSAIALVIAVLWPRATSAGPAPPEEPDLRSAVKLTYDDEHTPTYIVFGSMLTVLSGRERRGRQGAIGVVEWWLNAVIDESTGNIRYPTPDKRPYDRATAESLLAYLLALNESIQEQNKAVGRQLLCPIDRARPEGEAAFAAIEARRAQRDAILASSYYHFRSEQPADVVHRLGRWLEKQKHRHIEVRHDVRKAYELTGTDVNAAVYEFCLNMGP